MEITYIYLVENCYGDPNKVYIGETRNSRKSAHRKTYGDKITYTVIDSITSIDKKDWKPLECYWIEQFRQWGFDVQNINDGGGGPTKWSDEQKARINPNRILKIKNNINRGSKISKSLVNHSQYYTKDVKDKISKGNLGIPKPLFTNEHIINLRIGKIKFQGKPVLQFDLNNNFINRFESKSLAAKWMIDNENGSINIDKQIKDCCLGRQKTCYNYKWKYEEK